jgi:UDP-GlcNAc:undecaprenyl-phosphate GlcNAc-1-phosphate transferase
MLGLIAGVVASGDSTAVSFLPGIVLIAGVGAWEDVFGVPIRMRLLTTALAACMLTLALEHTGLVVGYGSLLVLIVAVPASLAIVNAVNFMDGINGISAAYAVGGGVAYAFMGHVVGSTALQTLGLVVAAASLGFAPYNAPTAIVFLGDVGSYGLGAVLASLCLLSLVFGVPFEAALAPLAIYLADTGLTLARRIREGERLSSPHRRHTYQQLVAGGRPHGAVSASVGVLTLICAGLGAASMTGSLLLRLGGDLVMLIVVAGYLSSPSLVRPRTNLAV